MHAMPHSCPTTGNWNTNTVSFDAPGAKRNTIHDSGRQAAATAATTAATMAATTTTITTTIVTAIAIVEMTLAVATHLSATKYISRCPLAISESLCSHPGTMLYLAWPVLYSQVAISALAALRAGLKAVVALRWVVLAIACSYAIVTTSPSAEQQLLDSSHRSSGWQRHIRSPSRRTVAPVAVLTQYSVGNVSNEGGLVGASVGPTILSRQKAVEDIPAIVIDFGQNVVGQLSINFAGSKNTSEGLPGLTLAFSETLQYLTDRSDFSRSDNAGTDRLTPGTDQVAVKTYPYTWVDQLGCDHGKQVCADGLHGFRYVKIRLAALPGDSPHTSNLGSVAISSINLVFSGYLGTPETFTGYFECSDANITQWWYDAVYTNDLCTDIFLANNTEPRGAASPSLLGKLVLHDGAKRDRDPYVGDLAVAALTTYLSHDAPEAARNVLEDLALHQREDGWIPPASINGYTLPLFDYPLWWVVCSVDHVLYTGNITYLKAYYPAIVSALDGFYVSHTNSETRLIERPKGAGDFAFIPRTGPITYYNALYVHALVQTAALADFLGNNDDSARWRSRAATIASSLIKRNFNNITGAFFDGGPCSGEPICPTHAQDGNSLAILSGIVPTSVLANTSMAESILSHINHTMARPYGNAFYDNDRIAPGSDYPNRVYAFISYFEIAARFMASPNTAQSAIEELRRLYGWMATHDPKITFWEGIGADGTPYEGGFTSMAHGWSTGIVPLSANFVLGVFPTAPGFQEWIVKPIINTTDITWAHGLIPTPHGGIWVEWERLAKGFTLVVDSPRVTKGIVTVPFVADGFYIFKLDNKIVNVEKENTLLKTGYRDGHITISLEGGRHLLSVE